MVSFRHYKYRDGGVLCPYFLLHYIVSIGEKNAYIFMGFQAFRLILCSNYYIITVSLLMALSVKFFGRAIARHQN